MSAFAGWDKNQPSGESSLRASDDRIRSHNSILQALLQQEHYFTDGSANSAGEHKLGSARIWSGASSAVSASGRSGGLMWDETNSQLVAIHAATTTRLPALATANTWTASQTFSADVTIGTNSSARVLSVLGGRGPIFNVFAPTSEARLILGHASTVAAAGNNEHLGRIDFFNNDPSTPGAGVVASIVGSTGSGDGSGGAISFWTQLSGASEPTFRGRIGTNGQLLWGTSISAGSVAGEIVLANSRALCAVNAAGDDTASLISRNSGDKVLIDGDAVGTTMAGAVTMNSTLSVTGNTTLAAQLSLSGITTSTTVGAAGAASALPATPTGYITVTIAGTARKIPFYAS